MAADWMDREQGYVKLWRQTLSSDLMQDPHLLQLFLYCLMRATYIERSVSVKVSQGMTQVTLQPGQLIYGRVSTAKKLGQPSTSTYNRLKRLRKLERVSLKHCANFTIVTIVNWPKFQQDQCEQEAEQPPVKKATPAKKGIFAPTPPVEIPASLDTPAFRAAWGEYVEHRREIKKPMTERAQRLALNKLAAYKPGVAVKALHESIANGWTGVFPGKVDDADDGLVFERVVPSDEDFAAIMAEGA